MPSPPRSPLFPYTTLFRSGRVSRHGKEEVRPMELFQHFFTSSTSVEFTALLATQDRKSTRLNSSHVANSYADFCFKKKSTGSLRAGHTTLSVDLADADARQ